MLKFKIKVSIFFTILLCCVTYLTFAQHHISKYEKKWALFHPFTALKIKRKLPDAMKVYARVKLSKELDTLENGGKLDAFRHVYVMAYLARTIKVLKLRKLGKAHEKGDKLLFLSNKKEFGEQPDSMACEMDLRNNEIGLMIGKANPKSSDEELKLMVISAIREGKVWYLQRNNAAQYVDCDGKTIDLSLYLGKWSIPKCLITTNK